MASKSAAAYRDAVAKEPQATGGHAHEHGSPSAPPIEVDHGAHAMTPDAHAAHGVATEHAEHGASATAHAGHAAAPDAHAGMQHDSSAPATMDHSQHGAMQQQAAPDPHAGHGATTPAAGTGGVHGAHSKAAAVPPHSIEVPNTNSEMERVRPADTLKQDALDAPAPSAVAEAQKKGH